MTLSLTRRPRKDLSEHLPLPFISHSRPTQATQILAFLSLAQLFIHAAPQWNPSTRAREARSHPTALPGPNLPMVRTPVQNAVLG